MGFLSAAVQMRSDSDVDRCQQTFETLVRRAAGYGASLITTPEATNYLGPHDRKVELAEPLTGPTVQRYQSLASELGVTLLVGSVNEASPVPGKCFNTSVLIGPTGDRLAHYRKLHLFDVDASDELRFFESATTEPGDDVVVADTPVGRIGLSICYDLRFPELYRRLRDAGAQILAVPSAFTLTTGKDHWHPLLRARAIETQCFVIAPGQHGHHDDAGLRQSYGHSMIVDPWGQILGMAPDGEGLALAEIDLDRIDRIRTSMPLSQHRRL